MAKGYKTDKGIRIAVTLPEELFKKIDARARKAHTSFSQQAADAIKCGLMCLEESELYDEPVFEN